MHLRCSTCECMFVFIYQCGSRRVYEMVCMWRTADSLQLSVLSFPPCLSQGLFAAVWARLAGLRACIESPVSASHLPVVHAGITDTCPPASCLCMGSGAPNKFPHKCFYSITHLPTPPSTTVFNFKFRFPSVFLSCSILHQLSSDFIQFFVFSWNSLRTLFLSFKFI